MPLLDRLLGAGPYRKHRFVDGKGNPVSVSSLPNAPRAFVTAALRKLFHYQPELPWISYRAIRELERLCQPSWNVIEFGSGMSTLWLVRHCGFIHSVESDSRWYERISVVLKARHIENIKYELREPNLYADVTDFPDQFFDFALIDGIQRDRCVTNILPKMKRGGWVYVDNTDADMQIPNGEMRLAEASLLNAIREREGRATYFIDFAPTQFFVNQGLLARL